MTEFKGTPAPWRFIDRTDGGTEPLGEIPFGIEKVMGFGVLPIADLCFNPNNYEVIKANAALISAAPELLESAQSALELLNSLGCTGLENEMLRDAITKALTHS